MASDIKNSNNVDYQKKAHRAQQNTCLLVVNSFSSCPINCNVVFMYLHVVSTATDADAAAVHLVVQLSGLCKVHVGSEHIPFIVIVY